MAAKIEPLNGEQVLEWEPDPDKLIHWKPHEGPQTAFMADMSDELLYGGAAGGGKSDALIIAALGLGIAQPDGTVTHAIDNPKYRAIIFRKQSTDLTEVIDRCLEIYPYIEGCEGVRYYSVRKWFVFPSGARVELGSIPDPGDELKYKSRQFQFIGWEELTEHANSNAYEYLMSRLRGPKELPKLVRSTTNPDGPGNTWVKKWFNINGDGDPVPRFEQKVEIAEPDGTKKVKIFTRRFIPAKVTDNPSIDEADPMYKFRLAQMSEDKRQALLEGRWDIVNIAGVIFQRQLVKLYEEKRVGTFPYRAGYPVHTYWDLGKNDSTSIWFAQHIDGADYFIDYYENRHEALEHYVKVLQSKDYVYGRHFLPHDAAHKKQGKYSNDSIEDSLDDLGLGPLEIVPRCQTIAIGIEAARQAFSSSYFDETKCEQGLDCLKNYRFKDSGGEAEAQTPLHNWASNGADAYRQFGQTARDGNVPRPERKRRKRSVKSAYDRGKRIKRKKRKDRSWVV